MSFDKILVQLNDKKFVIHIESATNDLKNVCHEISRQTKQLVSFETHLFEIFEADFEEYVHLNENEVIKHLSRIRIKDKIQDSNQLSDNSEKPKTVSDIDFEDHSSHQTQDFSQSLDYSREMTSFWVNSIPQNAVSVVTPISNSFVKPFDTQSERSCGHSSVSSSGLRSFRSEVVKSSVDAKHTPNTVSTTGLTDNKNKNRPKKSETDFNSFCDYLFVTKSSNSSKSDNLSDKSVSTQRPEDSTLKLEPSLPKSNPFRCDNSEKDQINDNSCDESNKWFMNFAKDKSVVRERMESNDKHFNHFKRFDSINQFIKHTNQKSGHKSVETISETDLEFNSNIEDNSDFGLHFSEQSSPKRLNKSTISSTITSKSLNESLFGSNSEVLSANPLNFNSVSHQKSVNSSVDSNPKTFSEDIQKSDFIQTLFNSVTTNTNVDQKSLSPLRRGSGDQSFDKSDVSGQWMDSCHSPADKLQKAMNSLKEKRVFENIWSNQSSAQMPSITLYDSNSNDLSSFKSDLFKSDSNVFNNNFIGVTSHVFENSESEPKPQSNEMPIRFEYNSKEEINILSNSDYFDDKSDTFDEFIYNCDDIKNADKEIIVQNEDLNSSSSDETIVASLLESIQKCDQTANDFESKSESDLQMDCNSNDKNSVWFIPSDCCSEPINNSSSDESKHDLSSDFENTSDKQTLESTEDSNITEEQTVLAKECLNLINDSVEEDIESNNLCEGYDIDITSPKAEAIGGQTIEKCCQNSNEASFDENDWESNPDLKRIKLNSFELFGDSEPIKQMLQILDRNKTRFAKNVLTHFVDDPKWKIISKEMVEIGFSEWSLLMCKTNFIKSFRLYKESLIKCPDIETAVIVYPLFTAFHSVDLIFILSAEQFKHLEELKESFDKKQKSKVGKDIESEEFEDLEPLKDKIAIESTKLEKISKLTEQKINLFKAMVECVDDITKEYGHVSSVNNFWDLVTGQMKLNGFRIYTDDFCKDFFRECVNDYYSMILIKAPELETAQRVYRLFEFIHSLDLKLYLTKTSFKKIRKLRKEFSERINKTSNNV